VILLPVRAMASIATMYAAQRGADGWADWDSGFPNDLRRPAAGHGSVDYRGCLVLSELGRALQRASFGVDRDNHWHHAFERSERECADTNSVGGGVHGREPRRFVRDHDTFGCAGNNVPAWGNVSGAGWSALGTGRLRRLPSGSSSVGAAATGAVGTSLRGRSLISRAKSGPPSSDSSRLQDLFGTIVPGEAHVPLCKDL
jgi:hypothetical protein